MEPRTSYTGRPGRKTRWSVRLTERLARLCITVAGIGTILAVSTICIFLVVVVTPLFLSASLSKPRTINPPWQEQQPLLLLADEYQLLGSAFLKDGSVLLYRLDTGALLNRLTPEGLYKGAALTACTPGSRHEEVALGFADGTLQLGRIGFATSFLDKAPAELKRLDKGEVAEYESGLACRTPEGQLRLHKLKAELDEPIKTKDASAVRLIDQSQTPAGPVVISMVTQDGNLHIRKIKHQEIFTTGEIVKVTSGGSLALPGWNTKDPPHWLQLTGVGDNVYLIWEDGRLLRIGVRSVETPQVAEELNLLDQADLRVTSVQFQLGKSALLVGDSSGRVRAWYPVHSPDAASKDGTTLVVARTFEGTGSPVTCLATSSRTRTMAVGYADGKVRLYGVTSEKFLGEVQTKPGRAVQAIVLTPRDDGLIAQTGPELRVWTIQLRHPEIALKALFRPVWYEGYPGPAHVWQSSGGDEVEAKFGMWPLIFGTIKGAFYSLLLGVPLALLAAIYTSEFLHPRTKAVVKPAIEMMASLPSVVLGFLAALVLAPVVEDWLSAVFACFITLPGAFLLAAYCWQLLPPKLSVILERWRFLFLFLVLPLGLGGAALLGPLLENWLFQGSIRAWLGEALQPGLPAWDRIKARFPGWFLLLLPLSALLTVFLMGQVVNPVFRSLVRGWRRLPLGLADLVKFLGGAAVSVDLAALLATLLSWAGLDSRGSLVGTYVQRNALVVSFMIGFAIIPIIYTIAEDSLSLVPEHLRSASLGCGATPWQTAVRIIVPTAMSGLFSAVMVGMGRAVGETMVMLMVVGGTPIMDCNVFNGFRTLAANIAIEMPEAVPGTTHARTLFLAALLLFILTFVLNTIAELVRLRFRKRAFQL